MRKSRRWAAVALVVLAGVGLAGCGGDDTEDGGTATGDTEETTDGESAEGSARITVDMKDYAYEVSGPLTASEAASIEFTNSGQEYHMAAGGKLADGKTLEDVTELLSSEGPGGGEGEGEGGDEGAAAAGDASTSTSVATGVAPEGEGEGEGEGGGAGAEEGGGGDPFEEIFDAEAYFPGTFLSPGATQSLTIPIEGTGEYVMICFIPTPGEGAPHFAKGMIGSFTVTDEGEAGEAPDATGEYTFGDTVEGPTELEAGTNVLSIDVPAGHQPVLIKPDDGKTLDDLDRYLGEFFDSEQPPATNPAADAPAEIVAALDGSSEEDQTIIYTVDLQPGTYVLGCVEVDNDDEDEDPANDVRHAAKEFVTITVA